MRLLAGYSNQTAWRILKVKGGRIPFLDFWNGNKSCARTNLKNIILGTTPNVPNMYWDTNLRILREPTDSCTTTAQGSPSSRPTACAWPTGNTGPCQFCDVQCNWVQFSYKLGLYYYALRAMGIEGDPSIATQVSQMQNRFGATHRSDGGAGWAYAVNSSGVVVYTGAANIESTAIAVLANTVQHAP